MTKKKYNLVVIAPPEDYKKEIICDNMDASSGGFYYFYNIDDVESGHRDVIAYYPINRTCIESIEEFKETPVDPNSEGRNKISQEVEKI